MKHLFLIVLFLPLSLTALRAVTLELKAYTEVHSPQLTLGDLVSTIEDGPSDLRAISLGNSPSLGGERNWTRDSLTRILRGRVKEADLQWSGTNNCRVYRPARILPIQELRASCVKELRKMTGQEGEVEIAEFAGVEPFRVPASEFQTELEFGNAVLQSAWNSVTLRISIHGEPIITKSFRIRWSWIRAVWQSKGSIPSGEGVNETNFKPVRLDILQQVPGLYLSATLPADATLTRSLAAGKVLTMNDFKARMVVKRGTNVMLHYHTSGVSIAMEAVALEDGARGTLINVQNPTSKKRILARVVDETTLEYAN